MNASIPFVKMVATGNDFLMIDAVRQRFRSLARKWPQLAKRVCDRRYGVGADGVLLLEPSTIADCRMRVFNSDGSEAEMCGNGARCAAAFISQRPGRRSTRVVLETRGGVVKAQVRRERVQIQMPTPRDLRLDLHVKVEKHSWRLAYVDTGVPHAVAVVKRLDQVDVERVGRQLRWHQAFQPRGANVDFIEADPRRVNRLRIRTYERGVEGETLACGTGVTAAAVIHALASRTNGRPERQSPHRTMHRVTLEAKSGEVLTVTLTLSGEGRIPQITNVTLEGSVRWICQGLFPWATPANSSRHRQRTRR